MAGPNIYKGDGEDAERGYSGRAVNADGQSGDSGSDPWMDRARSAYNLSSDVWETNFYRTWQHSLSNFRSKHPPGSKYYSDQYRHRSKLFRPKIRSATRRAEAQANSAFFTTSDVVSFEPEDESDPMNVLAAELREELLNYRLNTKQPGKGIPWFTTLIGAYQETRVMGAVCSCQEWVFEELENRKWVPEVYQGRPVLDGKTGQPAGHFETVRRVVKDRPDVRLVPLENIRFHPTADWRDPVNTSPFFIELIPFYVHAVREKMEDGEWIHYDNVDFAQARRDTFDTVRQEREGRERRDPMHDMSGWGEYTVVWVHRNIIRHRRQDYVYHTLGTYLRLDEPRPLEEFVLHGQRPYVFGSCMVEAHRNMPSSPAELGSSIQSEANETVNSRRDNVRLALNKRYKVKRDSGVDIGSLRVSAPGSAVVLDNMGDVEEMEFNDVTSSSYEEQDRLNLDFDEIMGLFSSGSVQSNRKMNETVGGMNLLSQDSNQMSEHDLKVFAATWVAPVIAQLDLLEIYYETDATVLAVAGRKSKAWAEITKLWKSRYGTEAPAPTPDLMERGGNVAVQVAVGWGATNPQGRLQRVVAGFNATAAVAPRAMQRVREKAVIDEIFGAMGYQSGSRFFEFEDEQVLQLKQENQALQKQLEEGSAQAKAEEAAKAESALAAAKLKETAATERTKMELASRERIARMTSGASKHAADQRANTDRARNAVENRRFKFDVDRFNHETARERESRQMESDEMVKAGRESAKTAQEMQRQVSEADRRADAALQAVVRMTAQLKAMGESIKDLKSTGVGSWPDVGRRAEDKEREKAQAKKRADAERAQAKKRADADQAVVSALREIRGELRSVKNQMDDAEEKRARVIEFLKKNGSERVKALLD